MEKRSTTTMRRRRLWISEAKFSSVLVIMSANHIRQHHDCVCQSHQTTCQWACEHATLPTRMHGWCSNVIVLCNSWWRAIFFLLFSHLYQTDSIIVNVNGERRLRQWKNSKANIQSQTNNRNMASSHTKKYVLSLNVYLDWNCFSAVIHSVAYTAT